MNEKLYNVGKIVNTHGIKGELKIVPQTDFPQERFKKDSILVISDPVQKLTQVQVERARLHKDLYILKLVDIDHINDAEKYKGCLLKVREQDLQVLAEDEYYYHEIIGCQVVTEEGEQLGTILEILSPGANDVWVVERAKGKPVLIPVIDDVLISVDVEEKLVKIRLMEGLIDE